MDEIKSSWHGSFAFALVLVSAPISANVGMPDSDGTDTPQNSGARGGPKSFQGRNTAADSLTPAKFVPRSISDPVGERYDEKWAAKNSAPHQPGKLGKTALTVSGTGAAARGAQVELLLPLSQEEDFIWFTQIGVRKGHRELDASLGFGRRHLNQKWGYWGYNLFYDLHYGNDDEGNGSSSDRRVHFDLCYRLSNYSRSSSRLGIGLEQNYKNILWSLNGYLPLSSWRTAREKRFPIRCLMSGVTWGTEVTEERAAGGLELRVAALLPGYEQLSINGHAARYWGGEVKSSGAKSANYALAAGVNFTPVPLVSIGYQHAWGVRKGNKFSLTISYQLGSTLSEQLNPQRVASASFKNPANLVQRDSQMVLVSRVEKPITVYVPRPKRYPSGDGNGSATANGGGKANGTQSQTPPGNTGPSESGQGAPDNTGTSSSSSSQSPADGGNGNGSATANGAGNGNGPQSQTPPGNTDPSGSGQGAPDNTGTSSSSSSQSPAGGGNGNGSATANGAGNGNGPQSQTPPGNTDPSGSGQGAPDNTGTSSSSSSPASGGNGNGSATANGGGNANGPQSQTPPGNTGPSGSGQGAPDNTGTSSSSSSQSPADGGNGVTVDGGTTADNQNSTSQPPSSAQTRDQFGTNGFADGEEVALRNLMAMQNTESSTVTPTPSITVANGSNTKKAAVEPEDQPSPTLLQEATTTADSASNEENIPPLADPIEQHIVLPLNIPTAENANLDNSNDSSEPLPTLLGRNNEDAEEQSGDESAKVLQSKENISTPPTEPVPPLEPAPSTTSAIKQPSILVEEDNKDIVMHGLALNSSQDLRHTAESYINLTSQESKSDTSLVDLNSDHPVNKLRTSSLSFSDTGRTPSRDGMDGGQLSSLSGPDPADRTLDKENIVPRVVDQNSSDSSKIVGPCGNSDSFTTPPAQQDAPNKSSRPPTNTRGFSFDIPHRQASEETRDAGRTSGNIMFNRGIPSRSTNTAAEPVTATRKSFSQQLQDMPHRTVSEEQRKSALEAGARLFKIRKPNPYDEPVTATPGVQNIPRRQVSEDIRAAERAAWERMVNRGIASRSTTTAAEPAPATPRVQNIPHRQVSEETRAAGRAAGNTQSY